MDSTNIEVSLVTEVDSSTVDLAMLSAHHTDTESVKGLPMESGVQFEVVTSEPTIPSPPGSVTQPTKHSLQYPAEKDEAIAEHVRELLSKGEKITMHQLCQYAKSIIHKEAPKLTLSTSWGQEFLARHSINIGHKTKQSEQRGRPLSYSTETDKQLADYVRARISEGQFTNTELRKYAREVISKENPTFTGSASWAQNFLHRHKISLQSTAYDPPATNALLSQQISDAAIGPAAEITPTTSGMYTDTVSDDTMKTALAILTGESIEGSTLAEMSTDPVSLVDLLTNAGQLATEDNSVSLITSGLESPSGNLYLNLSGADSFPGSFTTADVVEQPPVTETTTKPHNVVAQASRPLSYTRETDLQLAKWVHDQQTLGKKVTFASLRAQAKKLISQENPNFSASTGWVTPFLLRNNLDLNLNYKKKQKETRKEELTESSKSMPTTDSPMLTSDILASAIATSLVEQANFGEQARLVLAQSGLLMSGDQGTPAKSPPATESPLDKERKGKIARNRHTLAEKVEVVRLMKEFNVAPHYVCRTLGIANSTFAGWTKLVSQKSSDIEALSSNRKRANLRGQGRPLSYSREIDEAIAKWVRTEQELGAQVTPSELGKYATSLINNSHFTASSGWQQKFLQRHNLQLNSSMSSKNAPMIATVEDKLSAEDQTVIPAPIQTEEVVSVDYKTSSTDWAFGSETDVELAKWVKEQVAEYGSYSVAGVCKKANEMLLSTGFKANLGWAFKFLHTHNIMLDPKPTISQLCASALNRKRSPGAPADGATPKKPCPAPDVSMSPSTGNLCEALLALSNQSSSEETATSVQAALQSLQTAVVQVIQQQALENVVPDSSPDQRATSSPKKPPPIAQTSNTYFHKPAREFSSDEKEEVVRYANATTLSKASSKYGVAAPTVWRWRVDLKLNQPKYTNMQKKHIIKFAETKSYNEASTRFGVGSKTIFHWRKALMSEGDHSSPTHEEGPPVSMVADTVDQSKAPVGNDMVTYDTQGFQFIVDGGEVIDSRPPTREPLSLEVTNEMDIENVGMEYDIVSSEGHAAKPRCTQEEKERILQFALEHSVREASNKYGISQGTLYYWKKNMSSNTASSTPLPTSTVSPEKPSQVPEPPLPPHTEHVPRDSTTQASPVATASLQQIPNYVNFLNTVSAVSSLLSEEDKSKASQIIHSPTDVLVTPFTPHSDIETTTTVTVVTTDGSEEVGDVAMETSQQPEVEVQDISQTVELVEDSNEQ